jgi:ArsR family transcriptional regulator
VSKRSDKEDVGAEDSCELVCVDRKRVGQVRRKMQPVERLMALADLFDALGDSTRVRLLHALSYSELCVCDLAALIGLSQSAISHQLRLLRMSRLVKNRKDGKMVYYSLDDEHVGSLLAEGLKHVGERRG